MESYSYGVSIAVAVIFTGAAIQTIKLFPNFFDAYFDRTVSKITVISVLFVVSFILLSLFLKNLQKWNREGFENPSSMAKWKELVDPYQINEICSLKSSIEERMIANEREVNKMTEDQAKETVAKELSRGTTNGTIDCALFTAVGEAKDIDSFFTALDVLPDSILIQAQETIESINSLLKKQVNRVEESLKKEGFVDKGVGICSGEVVEERRKFLREKRLDEEAQRCLLPEEVPLESKDSLALKKLKKIQSTFDDYIIRMPGKQQMSELIESSKQLKAKLEERGKQAESGEILKDLQI